MKTSRKNIFFYLILFISVLIIYYPNLNYYFFQDDWFVLRWVLNADGLSLLNLRSDVNFYRPLSVPYFFKANYLIFGLDPFYSHSVAFTIFFAVLIAIEKLVHKLTQNGKASMLAAFFYGTSAVHFISLGWLSSTSYVIGTLFMVVTLFCFLSSRKFINYLSPLFFVFALLSSEMAVIIPAVLFVYSLIFKKKVSYLQLIFHSAIVCVYLVFRFLIGGVNATESYSIHLDKKIISNLIWYFVWSFNMPESFIDLISHKFVGYSLVVINQNKYIVTSSALLISFFIYLTLTEFSKRKNYLVLCSSWFLLGLLPFIIFPNHTYPHYLSFSIIGIILFFSVTVAKKSPVTILGVCVVWTLSSVLSTGYTQKTHWLVNEQAASRSYVTLAAKQFEKPQSGSTFLLSYPSASFSKSNGFYFKDMETLALALADQDALRVYYRDESIMTIYQNNENSKQESNLNYLLIKPE